MHIIVVSDSLARSKSYTLTRLHIAVLGSIVFAAMFLAAGALHGLLVRFPSDALTASAQRQLTGLYQAEAQRNEAYVTENVNALAVKLGEMQAQLMRLDSFGERLAKIVGGRAKEFRFDEKPGRGGPSPEGEQHQLTLPELKQRIDELSLLIEDRTDKLGLLENAMLDDRLRKNALPTVIPVTVGYHSSNYGSRIDPFNGHSTFHAGIDFVAPPGTPFAAAASGVVVASEVHPEYGNMIEIDHGNGLTSRYGHAATRLVRVGDVVLKGQQIGTVGSTGRSTGPHLHFEVRDHGSTLNPQKFLNMDS